MSFGRSIAAATGQGCGGGTTAEVSRLGDPSQRYAVTGSQGVATGAAAEIAIDCVAL